jgi:hypothetical protein
MSWIDRTYFAALPQPWPSFLDILFANKAHEYGLRTWAMSNIEEGAETKSYGIPIFHISDLFQQDFWDLCVDKHGADTVKVWPRLLVCTWRVENLKWEQRWVGWRMCLIVITCRSIGGHYCRRGS